MPGVEDLILHGERGDVVLRVTGCDRLTYEWLLEEHPPRPEEDLPWNDVTFPPALLHACTNLTPNGATRMWHDGETDEAEDAFETCLRLSAPGEWSWAKRRIERDPRLKLELRLCNKAGISHSHFLGGPPMWTDRDRDLALAALELTLDVCPGCSVPRKDMQDPDAADIEQSACVHCELKARMWAAIPEGERERIHLSVVPVRG